MALPVIFTESKYPLTLRPTTKATEYIDPYADLFALFNTIRSMWSQLDENFAALESDIAGFVGEAPNDGQQYARQSLGWSVVAAGTSGDMLSPLTGAEIAITTTATLTISRLHVASGTAADYTVTLPAVSGNTGKFIGLRIAPGCTRWITLKGSGSELIDGLNTRLMWRNESAVLFCDGVTWTKISGKSIPIRTVMYRTVADGSVSISAGAAWSHIPTRSKYLDNTDGMAVTAADTTVGRIRVLRNSPYILSGFVSFNGLSNGVLMAGGAINWVSGIYTPTNPQHSWSSQYSVGASSEVYLSGTGTVDGAVGSYFLCSAYSGNPSPAPTRVLQGHTPSVSATEVIVW